jgi:hypothetical protein
MKVNSNYQLLLPLSKDDDELSELLDPLSYEDELSELELSYEDELLLESSDELELDESSDELELLLESSDELELEPHEDESLSNDGAGVLSAAGVEGVSVDGVTGASVEPEATAPTPVPPATALPPP